MHTQISANFRRIKKPPEGGFESHDELLNNFHTLLPFVHKDDS